MSEHDANCSCTNDDCTCQDEHVTVTLTLDNDEEMECAVLTVYKAGEHQYIALLPLNQADTEDEGDVYIYRFTEDENGEPVLDNIENDDEYEIAADAFDEWLDSMEFEEDSDEQ